MPENTSGKIDNEEAKKIMINILSELADYCDENGLRYYLAYGTLLGAIRHKGFIPWDNDIDICMPRPDYNKLRELVRKKAIGENIRCLDYQSERTFPFMKCIDNRTILKERFLVTENNLGLYIDIFPLDGLPNDVLKREGIFSKSEKYRSFFALANYRFNTGSNVKIRYLKNIFYPISRLMNSKNICIKLDTLCNDFDFDSSKYVGNIIWGYGKKEILQHSWFENATAEFEGRRYNIPLNYDAILKNYYGDYMTLPPKEKQISHCYDAIWKENI